MFATIYKPHKVKPEYNDGPVLVNTLGYRNIRTILQEMKVSNMKLKMARAEAYDFQGNRIDWNYVDPTREKSFTEMEAMDYVRETTARIKEQRRKAQEDADKAKKEVESDSKKDPPLKADSLADAIDTVASKEEKAK